MFNTLFDKPISHPSKGKWVKATFGSSTTAYPSASSGQAVGDYFEWTGSTGTMVKYYYAGGQRVAMRVGSSTVYYLLTDHLGSTAITANSSGSRVAELRYKAWGETRYTYDTMPTAYKFTGQRLDDSTGLYYYGARYYDAALGRFVQADTIVPEPGNPQALNRYSYVYNNPLRYIDPTGFDPKDWDPAWVERYKAAHGGAGPNEQDWQDYLLSLQYPGTGPNGAWTEANWLVYYQVTSWLGADLLSQIGQTGSFGTAFYTSLGINLANWYLQPGPDGTWIAVSQNFPFGVVPPGVPGWTLGNVIILRAGVMMDERTKFLTLIHEYVHVLQCRFKGITYGPDYVHGGLYNWRTNVYERQAVQVANFYRQHTWLPPVWAFPWAGGHFYWTAAP